MQETIEYTDDYLDPAPDELFPEQVESVPELINSVEDAILHQSVRNNITHQPVLNDEGLIVATRQDMMLGYRKDDWPKDAYRWTTIKTVTHETDDKAGETDYTLIFDKSSSDTRSVAPVTWSSGAKQLELRMVSSRGAVIEKAKSDDISDMRDTIMDASKVVDLTKEVVRQSVVRKHVGKTVVSSVVSKIEPRDD